MKVDYYADTKEYLLGFPNREVDGSFWSSLATRFFRRIDGNPAFNLRKCLRDVNEGRAEG